MLDLRMLAVSGINTENGVLVISRKRRNMVVLNVLQLPFGRNEGLNILV
jgi:hypothetical protein